MSPFRGSFSENSTSLTVPHGGPSAPGSKTYSPSRTVSLSETRCSSVNAWMGVTSEVPQKARIRQKPGLKCLNGGNDAPWVYAAPRPTLVQKPSTNLGVTRTSSTGGTSATYSDQLPKSVSRRNRSCAASDQRMSLLRPGPPADPPRRCAT